MKKTAPTIVGVLGNGGRESAFIRSVLTDENVEKIIWCNPNGGFIDEPRVQRIELPDFNPQSVTQVFQEHQVTLAMSGPEAMAVDGFTDALTNAGIAVFGASQRAVLIESDKAWARDFMAKLDIPQPKYQVCASAQEAKNTVREHETFRIVKATGPAGGKGVIVCETVAEAEQAITEIMIEKRFGSAGDQVVIEERLGWNDPLATEVSLMFYTDGKKLHPLPLARDYKKEGDNNAGENTGGMGTHTAPDVLDAKAQTFAQEKIAQPLLDALRKDNRPFIGILYVGLMKTNDLRHNPHGLFVIEINARGGDPETIVQLAGQQHPHIAEFYAACAHGDMSTSQLPNFDNQQYIDVVLCAPDYPRGSDKGTVLQKLGQATSEDVAILHAGTRYSENTILTNGGRILHVVGNGATLAEAREKCYQAISTISDNNPVFKYRTDIGA